MKVYVTSRFSGADEQAVEALCGAVRAAGLADFSFIRDIEHYEKVFDTPQQVWQRSREELAQCDALLVDVSDAPTGGRVLETGIAYALALPIFVAVKKGVVYKSIFEGVATKVIEYETYHDITAALADYIDSGLLEGV
ncbi:MAG TPA: hypothetical protein VLE99_06280 [Candidatus Saccharimonadales bacterium]|nr:hypothetical protein [Candidatus Saccharimonadales bacterium]